MRNNAKAISDAYALRADLLKKLARTLEKELKSLLQSVPHVDRVYFRVKELPSFLRKATEADQRGRQRYYHPLEEIEDQVAGRVLVFYRPDIREVLKILEDKWPKAEQEHRRPIVASQFAYETTHRICVITPDMRPPGWLELADTPTTFELQIRTLAQHAWSEPQHAFYKNRGGLEESSERKLYWAAASAWGIDSIWEDLQKELKDLDH
jgi:putative GTP pyrophosphokinase